MDERQTYGILQKGLMVLYQQAAKAARNSYFPQLGYFYQRHDQVLFQII